MSLDKQTQRLIESNVLASVRNVIMIVLCAGMMGLGMVKLVGEPKLVAKFAQWGMSRGIVFAIGLLELGIAISLFIKASRQYAIIALIVLLISAISTHILFRDTTGAIAPMVVLLGAVAFWGLDRLVERR